MLIANIVLIIVTSVYVFLTYQLFKETKKANDLNRENADKQFKLSVMPQLCCNLRKEKSKLYLSIYNGGNVLAQDVDVLVLGCYSVEDMSIQEFLEAYVRKEYKNEKLEETDEGLFYVYDRICYAVFSSKKKIVSPLDIPESSSVQILLQFRDLFGNNYSQIYQFFHEDEDDYKLGSIVPLGLKVVNRVGFDMNRNIIAKEGVGLPDFIEQEFSSSFHHSIPSGYTILSDLKIEDRGKWMDI